MDSRVGILTSSYNLSISQNYSSSKDYRDGGNWCVWRVDSIVLYPTEVPALSRSHPEISRTFPVGRGSPSPPPGTTHEAAYSGSDHKSIKDSTVSFPGPQVEVFHITQVHLTGDSRAWSWDLLHTMKIPWHLWNQGYSCWWRAPSMVVLWEPGIPNSWEHTQTMPGMKWPI